MIVSSEVSTIKSVPNKPHSTSKNSYKSIAPQYETYIFHTVDIPTNSVMGYVMGYGFEQKKKSVMVGCMKKRNELVILKCKVKF